MIWLLVLAVFIVLFPRLLVWGVVGVFFAHLGIGFYKGLKQPGNRKRQPGHSTGSANWDHLTDKD